MIFKYITIIFILISKLSLAQAENLECGSLKNGFGPYDYRTEKGSSLELVESAHFTQQVEMLISATTGYIGGDIDYTLRAFPNHHRALMSVMRYGEKTKSAKPPSMKYTVECYFDRAIRFRPDDAITRMIYSIYLAKNNRTPEALQQLDVAGDGIDLQENAFTHYNLGLSYFDLKEYDKSAIHAHKAYRLGFPQTALKDKLKSVGKWIELEAELPNDSASTSTPLN
ncbi:MAG: hypothetical protein H7240_04045 [Glaciimonas sp.]|nr:hypothetical protein [Glaciimonas sp.]